MISNLNYLIEIDPAFEPKNLDGLADILSAAGGPLYMIVALSGLVLVAMLAWGGFTRLTAADSPQKVKQANAAIMWAIVGFGVIMASGIILRLVASLVPGYEWNFLTITIQ